MSPAEQLAQLDRSLEEFGQVLAAYRAARARRRRFVASALSAALDCLLGACLAGGVFLAGQLAARFL